jgi:hypothetical protein
MPDTLTLVREALEYAPAEPARTAPDLLGVLLPSGDFLCACCVGRLIGRGCGHLVRGEQVWTDRWATAPACAACAADDLNLVEG